MSQPLTNHPIGRPVVLGVLNVTPDSFSDGGRYDDLAAAVAHAERMRADGADLIDVGGESTRPGAGRVDARTELARVRPVIRELAAAGIPMSIDTSRAAVAAQALADGVSVVNDVSGGLADPEILRVAADAEATYVAMHWRAHADHMTDFATYDNPGGVVAAVRDELAERVAAALAAGVAPERLVLDPGLGFAKHGDHNWQLLADLGPVKALGYPLLVGASRKSFLGTLLADADGNPRPVDGREDATTALSVVLAGEGVWGLRVHDVRSTRDALRVLHALDTAREEGQS
jgi:dihydropteroate synthase